MGSAWQNIIIQLGISALVLFVVYQIAMKQLANQRAAEAERARAQAVADAERNAVIAAGFRAITDTQQKLADGVQRSLLWCAHIDTMLATVLDMSPVRHMVPTIQPINVPIPTVMVDPSLPVETDTEKTPVEPHMTVTIPRKTPTPPKGSSAGLYGVGKRPKTQG